MQIFDTPYVSVEIVDTDAFYYEYWGVPFNLGVACFSRCKNKYFNFLSLFS